MDKYVIKKAKCEVASGLRNDEPNASSSPTASTSSAPCTFSDSDTDSESRSRSPLKNQSSETNLKGKPGERKRLFCYKWLEIAELKDWLEKYVKQSGEEMVRCKFCDCLLKPHLKDLRRHLGTQKHILKSKNQVQQPKIDKMISITTLTENTRIAELKFGVFLCITNSPFSLMDILTPTLKSAAKDSNIIQNMALKRTKVQAIIKNVLGDYYLKELAADLKINNRFYSIVLDGTTDRSAKKQCAMAVMYYDQTLRTRFLDMVELPNETADNMTLALLKSLEEKGVPLKNLVGFSSDTTNVMAGQHHSVFTNLRKQVPYIACIKCSCHMIHLCASNACKKLPKFVEDTLRNIGSHFSRSHKRQNKFQEFQNFFQVEIMQILSPCSTRWLSVKACVDRTLGQFDALKHYFDLERYEDPSRTTDSIFASFNNSFFTIYLEFMSYILGLLCEFNLIFQSSKSMLQFLKPEVEGLLKTICLNFMEPKVVWGIKDIFHIELDDSKYIATNKIYLGVAATQSIQALSNEDIKPQINDFLMTIQAFYVELYTEIVKRFSFEDPLFNFINILNPETVMSGEIISLNLVINRFPILLDTKAQQLDNEWRAVSLLSQDFKDLKDSSSDFWNKIFSIKLADGSKKFATLEIVIKMLLCLPFSNACVERLFSDLDNTKTVHRNSLHTDTINSIFRVRDSVGDHVRNGGEFIPPKEMIFSKIWEK